jgi:hypothetical protein
VGASLDFEDFEPDTLTRSQLEAMRGPLDTGNGAGDLAVPVPNGKPGPQLCALPGCDRPVSAGRGARYCSEAHRRKASHLRNGRAARMPDTKPVSVRHPVGTATDNATIGSCGPFEQLAALPGLLPAGWRLEATADTVLLAWTR